MDCTIANVTENRSKLCLTLGMKFFKLLFVKFMNFAKDTAIDLLEHNYKFCSKKTINQYRLINTNLSGHKDTSVCMLPANLLILFSPYYYSQKYTHTYTLYTYFCYNKPPFLVELS